MGQLGPKGSRLGPLWLFFGLGRLLKGSQKSLWALKDMLGSLEGLNEVTVASGRSVVGLGRSLGDSPRSQGGSGSYSGLE